MQLSRIYQILLRTKSYRFKCLLQQRERSVAPPARKNRPQEYLKRVESSPKRRRKKNANSKGGCGTGLLKIKTVKNKSGEKTWKIIWKKKRDRNSKYNRSGSKWNNVRFIVEELSGWLRVTSRLERQTSLV